jgi:hypothetical protein
MIAITRAMARQFRAVARKCFARRTRAPDPDVVIRQTGNKISLTAHFPEVILQLTLPALCDEKDVPVVPMQVLGVILETEKDPVEIHCQGKLTGEARCVENGQPCSKAIQLIEPHKQHEPPTQPKGFSSVPEGFLKALHECGRSVADEKGRFALDRIQVRGKRGQVIATDSHIALIFGGFSFPFVEDLLIPAFPLFGLSDLHYQDVRVGRMATHLVVSIGPWTVWLAILILGKFPEVAAVVSRQSPTLVRFDPQDVTALLNDLAGLPGAKEHDRPVTLDLDGTVTMRGQDSQSKETREITLVHSRVEGPPALFALNRKVLARALSLGCLTLHIAPEKPCVAECEGITFLAMTLDPDLIVLHTENATPVASTPISQSIPPIPVPQRRNDVKPNEPNGRSPNGRPEPPLPSSEAADSLIAAEELRAALAEATLKANKLVAILRSGSKEKRVLASVFAGLKKLNLEGGPLS